MNYKQNKPERHRLSVGRLFDRQKMSVAASLDMMAA
jgi:hypothetical protein